jgi:hypothetical protein
MGLWNGHGDQGQDRILCAYVSVQALYDVTKMSSICVTILSNYATLIRSQRLQIYLWTCKEVLLWLSRSGECANVHPFKAAGRVICSRFDCPPRALTIEGLFKKTRLHPC